MSHSKPIKLNNNYQNILNEEATILDEAKCENVLERQERTQNMN